MPFGPFTALVTGVPTVVVSMTGILAWVTGGFRWPPVTFPFQMEDMMSIATATVKGGLFPEVGVSSLTSAQGSGSGLRRIRQQLTDKGLRELRRRAYTLDGVVSGTTATETSKRIEANAELGGKRTIETETLIGRATTAADITELNADMFTSLTSVTTLASPANKDGNPLGTR